MSYCINPHCHARDNPDYLDNCSSCGTSLVINQRLRLLEPLRPLEQHDYTEVFEVDDRGTRKVMKVLKSRDTKLIELLAREAFVLQILDHPGIPRVTIDDYFSVKPNKSSLELHCLIMQKFEGQNLKDWIKNHGRISEALALNWLKQIVEILDHVHRAGFFHRDIKLTNIMVRPDGQLALIDFGGSREVTNTYLAKVSGNGGNSTGIGGQYEITVIRTACYSPLEQINGQAVPQSDFYALGRTFVRLMTGIPLINLPTDQQTGKLIWRNKAPQIDKPLADFIDWLMAPAPGKRPQTTQVILQYLNARLPLLLRLNQFAHSEKFRAGVIILMILAAFGAYKGILFGASRYYFDRASQEQLAWQLEDAKKNYELAIKLNPNDAIAHNNLGLVCRNLKNFLCASANYKQALKLKSNYWQADYNLASLYDEQGNYAAAQKHYKLAMQSNPNLSIDATNNLSRLKNKLKDYPAATNLALQGLKKAKDPVSRSALYKNLGWAKLKQKRHAEAKTYLQKALELDPERTDAYCLLAQVQEAQQDMNGATQSWEVCLRLDSDLPEVREWRDQVLKRLFKK